MRQALVQNATISLQNTKKVYCKMRQMFYYKILQFYYKMCRFISFITKCVKILHFIQNATFIAKYVGTRISENHKELEIENRLIPTTMSQSHEIQSISGHPPLLSALELVTRTTYLYEK